MSEETPVESKVAAIVIRFDKETGEIGWQTDIPSHVLRGVLHSVLDQLIMQEAAAIVVKSFSQPKIALPGVSQLPRPMDGRKR